MDIDFKLAKKAMMSAARTAGEMLIRLQRQVSRLESRKDFLTDADLKSEGLILETLKIDFPDIPAFAEESGGKPLEEGFLWVIDPIDGTYNYFIQDNHWGVSIALVLDGKVTVAVIYLPAENKIFTADTSGLPAMVNYYTSLRNEDPLRVLKVNGHSRLRDTQVWLAWGKEERGGEDHERVYKAIKVLDEHSLYPQIRNSATADMMRLATGQIAGYVFLKPDPFDIAAAGLIVEKAGGTVTDLEGNPWGPFSRSIVASNGLVHAELLDLLKGI